MARRQKNSGAELNSPLIRKPIQRLFPLFLLPTFAAFCIGFLWPFVQGIYLSFCTFVTTSDATWVGLKNYVSAFQDENFIHAFGYTTLVAVTSLVLINILAFAVAYCLTRGIRGANVFRGVFFLPNLIGGIVLGYIWNMIFGARIKLDATFGFWGLMIVLGWQQIGYMMIIYIAGLQSVPEDMIEAAKIDGANKWQTLFQVTIPNVMPSITICVFLSLTNGFKLFDQNLALTGGLPYLIQPDGSTINTTEMLALNIYNTFYTSATAARGVAQAKAVIFFILVAGLGLAQLAFTRKREVQQ